MNVRTLCNLWLAHIKKTKKRRTYLRYYDVCVKHFPKALMEENVKKVTDKILAQVVQEKLISGNLQNGEGLSPSSVNTIIAVFKGAFNFAMEKEVISTNPCDKLKRIKCQSPRARPFSIPEQWKIIKSVLEQDEPFLFGIVIGFFTGLRIGELLALELSDIDLGQGLITVSKTTYQTREGSKWVTVVDKPKTNYGMRVIPIHDNLCEILARLKKTNEKFVVEKFKGKITTVRTYQAVFEKILEKLNINHLGFHAIRHSFSMNCIEKGVDFKTLSELLGHSDPTITMKRYGHTTLEMKKRAISRLNVVSSIE